MRKKKIKLDWKVYINYFGNAGIRAENVFEIYGGYAFDVLKRLKKKHTDKATHVVDKKTVLDEFERELRYMFNYRAEWETIVTSWPPHVDEKEIDRLDEERRERKERYGDDFALSYYVNVTTGIKIDVFTQLMMNRDRFFEYVESNIDNI